MVMFSIIFFSIHRCKHVFLCELCFSETLKLASFDKYSIKMFSIRFHFYISRDFPSFIVSMEFHLAVCSLNIKWSETIFRILWPSQISLSVEPWARRKNLFCALKKKKQKNRTQLKAEKTQIKMQNPIFASGRFQIMLSHFYFKLNKVFISTEFFLSTFVHSLSLSLSFLFSF